MATEALDYKILLPENIEHDSGKKNSPVSLVNFAKIMSIPLYMSVSLSTAIINVVPMYRDLFVPDLIMVWLLNASPGIGHD